MKTAHILASLALSAVLLMAAQPAYAQEAEQHQEQELEVECEVESYGQATCRARGEQEQTQRIAGVTCDEFVTREDGTKVCVHEMADTSLPLAGVATLASAALSGAGYVAFKFVSRA